MMKRYLRKLRGVIGIGLTWGALFAGVFAALGTVIGILDPDSIDPGEGPIPIAGILGTVGFISGLAFGVLLALAERRKSILSLSPGRAALWGVMASAVFPLLSGKADQLIVLCPVGAAVAAALVAQARKSASSNREHVRLLNWQPLLDVMVTDDESNPKLAHNLLRPADSRASELLRAATAGNDDNSDNLLRPNMTNEVDFDLPVIGQQLAAGAASSPSVTITGH